MVFVAKFVKINLNRGSHKQAPKSRGLGGFGGLTVSSGVVLKTGNESGFESGSFNENYKIRVSNYIDFH